MDIPVFCYHNAIADGLERDLDFLRRNGYRTLVASEVVDILRGRVEMPPKPVALTFDDGLLSLKTVGLPLFERYKARATVFAITGLTPTGVVAPTGNRSDRCKLLGWDDLRALRDSGLVEIGSHGHRHNPVHVAGNGGAPVRLSDYERLYDMPMPYGTACDAVAVRAADGAPARPARPLFVTDTILVDGATVSSREAIREDLRASAKLLREHLALERLHLCLPYGAGSETMPELAREAGFESIFWTRRADRDANRPGDDVFRIVRRKHDFVRRLPGAGRRSLIGMIAAKVKRRLISDPWE